ncbi:hypothetical protein BY996DRAFT_6416450 [Phakopsora pachyrhizi]|nr:hypothetical protein BY996DRAFT_6416450 [Phakopsora pachyrhizi]
MLANNTQGIPTLSPKVGTRTLDSTPESNSSNLMNGTNSFAPPSDLNNNQFTDKLMATNNILDKTPIWFVSIIIGGNLLMLLMAVSVIAIRAKRNKFMVTIFNRQSDYDYGTPVIIGIEVAELWMASW